MQNQLTESQGERLALHSSCRIKSRSILTELLLSDPILAELGLEWPEDTPMDTVTATDTTQFESVSASHVAETRSLGA